MYWNHGKATKNPSEEVWKQLKWTNPSHRRQMNMIQRCINQQAPRTTLLPTLHYPVRLEGKTSHMNTQHVQKWARTPFIQGSTGLEQVIALKLQDQTLSKFIVLNWQQAACLCWHSYCTAVGITYCTAVRISYDTYVCRLWETFRRDTAEMALCWYTIASFSHSAWEMLSTYKHEAWLLINATSWVHLS